MTQPSAEYGAPDDPLAPRPEPALPPATAPPPVPERSGHLTATAVLLIVTGVLVVLVALLVVISGAALSSAEFRDQIRDQLGTAMTEAAVPFLITLGIVLGAYGIVSVLAGIFVLPGRSWARITGLTVAVLGALFALLFVFAGQPFLTISGVVFLASYAYSAWALITRSAWFAPR